MKNTFMIIKNSFVIISILVVSFFVCTRIIEGKYTGSTKPIFIAHRGVSEIAPESTSVSYKEAMNVDMPILEGDVQRTKDGVLIVYHDTTFERTTNIFQVFPDRITEPVGNFTIEEVRQLDAGNWFNMAFPDKAKPEFQGLQVLTFEEFLAIAGAHPSTVIIYLESKSPELYPGIEQQIIDLLQTNGWGNRNSGAKKTVILQSFSPESILKFKEIAPEYERTYLLSWHLIYRPFKKNSSVKFAQQHASGIGPNKILCSARFIKNAQNLGLYVHTYTVNEESDLEKLMNRGVDGIFTDNVIRLKKYLNP